MGEKSRPSKGMSESGIKTVHVMLPFTEMDFWSISVLSEYTSSHFPGLQAFLVPPGCPSIELPNPWGPAKGASSSKLEKDRGFSCGDVGQPEEVGRLSKCPMKQPAPLLWVQLLQTP